MNVPLQYESFDCTEVVSIDAEPRHHLVIANEYVRAFAVEIAPGDRTLCHHHPHDYFLYVAGGGEIVSAARGEEPKRLSYRDAECELSSAGLTHVVDNIGNTPFRNVVIELLPRAGELRRGGEPLPASGHSHIDQLLESNAGQVFQVKLAPGAEVEISGPAVLAAPHEPVMMREVDAFDIPLDDFRKLIWVCAPRRVAIRNSRATGARAVVFQLGLREKP